MRWMCEHITDQRHDRAECCLAAHAVNRPVHLEEKCNRNHRAHRTANCGEDYMLVTERRKNIAARHHKKASKPRAREFLRRWPSELAHLQAIECEPTRVQCCHVSALFFAVTYPNT